MLRGWHQHYAGLSLYSVALNVFDRSEKRSTWKQRAEGPKLKPRHQLKPRLLSPVDSINILNEYNTADPYSNCYKHNSNFSLFSVKSKAVGYNDTVWVSISRCCKLLDKTSIFCNILSLSNWQIDVSPGTLYWQPNVVETRGSQDKDQRPERPRRPRRRSVTPELWYLYNTPLSPLWAVGNLTSTLKVCYCSPLLMEQPSCKVLENKYDTFFPCGLAIVKTEIFHSAFWSNFCGFHWTLGCLYQCFVLNVLNYKCSWLDRKSVTCLYFKRTRCSRTEWFSVKCFVTLFFIQGAV